MDKSSSYYSRKPLSTIKVTEAKLYFYASASYLFMVMNDLNTAIKKVIILHSFVVTKMYSIKLQNKAERQPELKRMGNVLWLKLSTTTAFCWRD